MRMIKQIYAAGDTLVTWEKQKRKKEKGKKRQPKATPTTEKVWLNNLRYSIFRLTLILNHNFLPGDWHLLLTYDGNPSLKEAEAYRVKFLDKLRRECRKAGYEIKWAMTTEYIGQKLHHHLVLSYVPKEIVGKCWTHGHVFYGSLWENPNRAKLAAYLLKQASKLFESQGCISKKRFTTSRNIEVPEAWEEEIDCHDIEADPTPEDGYYIDGGSDGVEKYEHAVTGLPCRAYVMIPYALEKKRLWHRGTRVKPEKINFTKLLREADEYEEKQMIMDRLRI